LAQQVLDLAVDTAQLGLRPGLQFGPERGINPQQKGFASFHRGNFPGRAIRFPDDGFLYRDLTEFT
jgi:hypothetical protein